jgi:hypothetical protein
VRTHALAALGVGIILTTGCAEAKTGWRGPVGTTQADFERDDATCQSQADVREHVSTMIGSRVLYIPQYVFDRTVYRACMERRGYELVPLPAPPRQGNRPALLPDEHALGSPPGDAG